MSITKHFREAAPGEKLHGTAGSRSEDFIILYDIGTKRNGVICHFKDPEQQQEAYCNDILLEIGEDGFVAWFDITERRDGK